YGAVDVSKRPDLAHNWAMGLGALRRRDLTYVAIRAAAVAVAYVLAARFGLHVAFENRNVTAVWPPTGIAVAALLVWGLRVWPGVLIGAFVANLTNHAGLATSAAITVGNTVAPVAGVYVLRRIPGFQDRLERLRDVIALFGIAGLGAMLISATLGTTALYLTGAAKASSLGSVWIVWWVGDALGVTIFAPFLILSRRAEPNDPINRRIHHAIALVFFTVGLTVAVFNMTVPATYLLFIPVVWAALEFEQAGAATVTVVVAVIAVAATVGGHGPFSAQTPTRNLVALQVFNAVLCFAGLALATTAYARNRAEQALRNSEDRYRTLFEKSTDFVCVLDHDGHIRYVNEAAAAITGMPRSKLETLTFEGLVRMEDVHIVRRALERLRGVTDTTTFEVHLRETSGRTNAFEFRATIVRTTTPTIQIIGRDISARNVIEGELRRHVLRDPATGLSNRTLFAEQIEYTMSIAEQTHLRFAVCVMDVDDFTSIGNAHGAGTADGLLRRIAHRLTATLGPSDTAARIGDDEFGVVLTPVESASAAVARAHTLSAQVRKASRENGLTVATGVAVYPDHASTGSALLAAAVAAMHAAKSSGPGAVELYGPAHAES
ncbi:MAG: MASE1 domain-containing protein, partial [Actinobacteria bacterium]|nr:MASE1 domain-containing protein [Actinomycetota bacterium]